MDRKTGTPKRGSRPEGAANEHFRAWMHAGLQGLGSDSAVLAIGCEQAFLGAHLAEYSSDVTVLDSSANQVVQLARRFPEIAFLPHNPANPLPFAHDTFEAIWCCEYLDRVFDPAGMLREMHRVLRPGGRLLVTVPDHGRMRNVLIALFNWEAHFAPSNPRIRHFTRSMLAKLALDAGFGEIALQTGGTVRRIAGELVPRSLLLTAKKGPAMRPVGKTAREQAREEEMAGQGDLAFASRTRAV